jgi:hypothetical protein
MFPFVLDMSANALNVYNTFQGTDLVAHLAITFVIASACGMYVATPPIERLNAWALVVCFGATAHTIWEIAEYGMMKLGALGLDLFYANTIHDLSMGMTGSIVAASLTVTVMWGRPFTVRELFAFRGDRRPGRPAGAESDRVSVPGSELVGRKVREAGVVHGVSTAFFASVCLG